MMHLLGPHITTTNYRKRKNKLTQGKMDMYVSEYVERCKRDKRFRLPTVSFDEFVSEMQGSRKKQKKIATVHSPNIDPIPLKVFGKSGGHLMTAITAANANDPVKLHADATRPSPA